MAGKVMTTERYVLFWGGWPSQWFKAPFEIEGVEYNCCEQYMMAEKARVFSDHVAEVNILATNNPSTQKSLGRKVEGFDPAIWDSVCRGVVYRGNLAKHEQNDDLKKLLLDTGERKIVEASPKDRIWGIGLHQSDPDAQDPGKWRGRNWLGIAIEQVRDELNRCSGVSAPAFDPELKMQLDRRITLNG